MRHRRGGGVQKYQGRRRDHRSPSIGRLAANSEEREAPFLPLQHSQPCSAGTDGGLNLCLADALVVDWNRRRLGYCIVLRCDAAGPFDAVFDIRSRTSFRRDDATSSSERSCAWSSSHSSSPQTSSSISSPCCPPSHDEMAMSEQCTRESTCTALRLLQHNGKNSDSA